MSEVVVHLHDDWEAHLLIAILRGSIPGVNNAEKNHIQNHIARAVEPDLWQRLVVDPDA
jgi:hypothetical protein